MQMSSFDLRQVHVGTIISPTAKAGDKSGLNYYCAYLYIGSSNRHIKLHFMSFDVMTSVMDSILQA